MFATFKLLFYTGFNLAVTVTFCSRDYSICDTDMGAKSERLAQIRFQSLTEAEPSFSPALDRVLFFTLPFHSTFR